MQEILRFLRPLIIFDKKTNEKIYLTRSEIQECDGKRFKFNAPNAVSLSLSISFKEYQKALKLFDEVLRSRVFSKDCKFIFSPTEEEKLCDYFEHVQSSIIFIYTAIESFINYSIPESYSYIKINNKKVKETWDKHSIERWISTSEKLTKILPDILHVNDPTKQEFWSDFLKLEEIRNDIIHQKTLNNNVNINTSYLHNFFSLKVFTIIRSGLLVINYFCKNTEKEMPHFPIGIGKAEFAPFIVEDINETFIPIYEDEELDF